jgi:HEPN domain-containing protein
MKALSSKWMKRADRHMRSAGTLVKDKEVPEDTLLHCQQAIEMYFKIYLSENNKAYERVHNLVRLYGEISKIKKFNIDEKLLKIIDDNFIVSRYPDDYVDSEMARKEIETIYGLAKDVRQKIKKELKVEDQKQPELGLK